MALYTTSIDSSLSPSDAFAYMAAFENVASGTRVCSRRSVSRTDRSISARSSECSPDR